MPPYVAQVPAAITAAARGARRSIQRTVRIGCPVSGSEPNAELLVRDRAFDDEHERVELAVGGVVERA
jgi:hypothetical protein